MNSSIAVKALIVNDKQELLLIRRRDNDVHKPGTWEIAGGRLDAGEDPFLGMIREAKEETNLDIEVKEPLGVHHFTRDDGQVITMIVFLCGAVSGEVKLSEEHTDFEWLNVDDAYSKIVSDFKKEIDVYRKYFS